MTDLYQKLNEAGEALKATGEAAIILSFFAESQTFTEDRFGIRIEVSGTSGVHGSGRTPAEAYQNAMKQREIDAERNKIEAEIRAEVEARFATMRPRKAA